MTQTLMQSITDQARIPRSGAGWRNVIGEIAEQIAADRLGAKRLSTGVAANTPNGQAYCADLHRDGVDFEVKACGLSQAIIIYYVRLLKDRWHAQQKPLCYVIVKHFVATSALISAYEAREIMEETARVYVIPFCYIDGVCSTLVSRILNKKYKPSNGWCQRGYEKGGYSIPWRLLEPHAMKVN